MTTLRDATKPARRILEALEARATTVRPTTAVRVAQRAIDDAIRALGQRPWRLVLDGAHYSGLSNQDLLEVRKGEGRDFDANTVQLKQWLVRELLGRYKGFGRLPTQAELEALGGALIINAICNFRVIGGGWDIIVPRLTVQYAARKQRAGKGSKPIGVWTGEWLAAVRNRGRVVFG